MLADGGEQLAGDDGLDAVLLAVQLAELLPAGEDVVGEEAPGLVAGELDHLAFVVADGDAQAVGVRVGGEDEVRAGFIGLREGHGHGRGLLRVRGDDRREVAVADILLGDVDDVLEADAGEGLGHELDAAAVQRGVDDLEVRVAGDGFRGQHQGQLVLQVAFVDLGAHRLDAAGNGAGDRGEADVGRVLDLRDLGDDVLVHGRGDLAAVAPEDLVAVILLGVVAGGDHDAGGRALEADGIAQFRGGAEGVEQVDVDAVVGEDVGGNLGEQAGVVAAVVRDAHAGGAVHMGLDVVREALGGHAHGVLVHAVGAHAHDAAEAAGAELEVPVEGVFEADGVGFLQFLDFCLGLGVEVPFEPALDHFLVIFHDGIGVLVYFSIVQI